MTTRTAPAASSSTSSTRYVTHGTALDPTASRQLRQWQIAGRGGGFLSQAHAVPGAGTKTPMEMDFSQMMAVLHPPAPETKLLVTTKLVRSIRRQTLGLGRMLSELWKMVPSYRAKAPVTQALSVLAYELDAVVDVLEDKSLIAGNVPSFG